MPTDLGRYYPPGYYAFAATAGEGRDSWRARLLDNRTGELVQRVVALLPDRGARVLEVGAGSGAFLRRLWSAGCTQLCGVDAFLPAEAADAEPFPLRRGTIEDCPGGWDLIMYHHVLEHVADPRSELAAAAARLRTGGRLLVRVPLADSWARRHYGANWVQWDAPRHLWLPTRLAMSRLAEAAGLALLDSWDDSTGFQVWGSERYRRGRTLDTSALGGTRAQLLAAVPGLVAAILHARWLNTRRQGDQGAFLFQAGRG
ncbi:MAG TPA: methyltransferase domain-containing protein [Opitutus sp.]|nr:methyltransferase domain-containing protein [Opitutus sp.]